MYTYRIDEASFISSRHSQPCRRTTKNSLSSSFHPADPHIYIYRQGSSRSSIFISIQRKVLRSSHAFPYFPLMSAHLPPGSFQLTSITGTHARAARVYIPRKSWNRHEMILSSESTSRKNFSIFFPFLSES